MKFGVNTFIWSAQLGPSELRLLPSIKEHGFDGVEVPMFNGLDFPSGDLRHALASSQLGCTICSVIPRGMSIFSDDPAVRRQTLTHLEDCVKAAADGGAELIAGPLYSPVGYLPGRRRTSDEWHWAVECYQKLAPTLDRNNITLAIEPLNRFETFFLNTAADGAALCDAVNHPRVGLLIDTFHSNIEEKDIADAYRVAGRHLKHVHTCENDRGIPGSGHVEWDSVFAALGEIGYDRWLTIESFGFNLPEISAAAAIWRDLAPSPDEIAWQGLPFLREKATQRTGAAPKTALRSGH